MNKKLVRITTVPISLEKLLSGQLRFMKSYYEVIAVSSDKKALQKIRESQQVSVFHVEMTRKITPIQDFIAILKLFFFLKKEKPFIVHTHTPKAGLVGMIASKLANVPNRFHTVAGLPLLEATGTKRKVLDFVETIIYKCATKVYPNSYGLSAIIKENKYCDSGKLKILANGSSNGIDTSYFNPKLFSEEQKTILKNDLKIEKEDFVFIFVGRLVVDKGINELVLAFNKLQQENNKSKLLLVGPFEDDLDPLDKSTLEEIKRNGSIISVDYQEDVRPYFGISNALVFPSYREGFPNVVMQAGAMGLPCIVSDINGCNEIIEENKNGIIIPVKNENAIFEAMKKISKDNYLWTHLQNNSRENIVSKYEQKVVWEAILNEYRELEKTNNV